MSDAASLKAYVATLPIERRASRFVYFIHAPLAERVKIGIAADPWMRLGQMQTGSPEKLTLLGALERENPREVERQLHSCWRAWHSHGEWFEAIPELLQFIREETRADWPALEAMRLPPVAEEWRPDPVRPQIRAGIEAPAGNSKAAKLARYKLARGIPV